MIPTSKVYQACGDLFDAYPLAVVAVEDVPTLHSIVLMLADGDDVSFFVLVRDCGDGRPAYTVIPWQANRPMTMEPDGGDVPDLAANAVLHGVPMPRDGALFGWTGEGSITALIVVYTGDALEPSWSVMPLVGIPRAHWPPFTSECLFGPWFWEHHRAGNLTYLDDVIAATPGTCFWVDTHAALGSDCCVVARDVEITEKHLLRRGRYVGAAALRAGTTVPTLAALLAGPGKTDLSARFESPVHCGR